LLPSTSITISNISPGIDVSLLKENPCLKAFSLVFNIIMSFPPRSRARLSNFGFKTFHIPRMLLLQLRDLRLADQYELPLAPFFHQNRVKHLYSVEAENVGD
jgi:hypothetical protein